MDASLHQQKPPDVSAPQDTSNDLVGLICKLRWMGMDEEADLLAKQLTQRQDNSADNVFVAHGETD
jgi:hypothetical protein